ncbi:MAG TPA: ABC transporter ATP-binding protein, partial [Anaerolineales bacterium]|nr:ABC transporter ATP-binding protein [Anaerolineales bacterium]HMX76335.1 ABC transporter ATP-binding protein [Anaerolineales bacterium]HMZ45053.1 ABC transporter ATP-binding protein [Anaerolineales bacterium]HNB88618.1 ABC transporter ATP-binding protein [Anaerolineales bacterium]HNH06680.1 ABC transporter ATP-binding protein [Anaerolineales bacterium]
MGFFAGLNDEKYDRQYSDRELTRRIAGFFKTKARQLITASVLVITLAFIGAALPVVVSRMVDLLREQPTIQEIALVGVTLMGVGVGLWGLNWMRRSLIVRAVGDVVLDLRTRAFRAAAEHDLSFYDQFSSGRIVSRITSDTNDFGQLIVIITDVVSQLMQAFILGVVLFRTELKLSLLLIAFMPMIFAVAAGFRALARRVTKRGMKAMADVNAAIKETISGISIAKNFRQEQSIFASFDESNQQSYQVNVRRGFVLALVFPTLNALSGVFVGILIYVGGMSAEQGLVSIGAWYLFIMSLDQFFFPILNLTSFWAQIQGGLSAAERVFALIDADPNVIQKEKQDVPRLKGEIRFENFDFSYSDKEPILRNFNLAIQPGETLALVGHTGAGKSSIAKLIARFYEYQNGELRIDGRDIRTFDLTQYRRQLGIVSQVPFLFSGTVIDNIRYAAPGVPESEMLKLAKKIGDGEWLETLPDGLHTEVGERGNRLSMGQRQLVALMRVLVQNPAIFILDEATASIDPFTEWQIQQALNLILKNTTSILIAHRLSTVKAADRIVVMQKGSIIEQGDHDGLLKQGGHYAELYNTYFRHQSLSY